MSSLSSPTNGSASSIFGGRPRPFTKSSSTGASFKSLCRSQRPTFKLRHSSAFSGAKKLRNKISVPPYRLRVRARRAPTRSNSLKLHRVRSLVAAERELGLCAKVGGGGEGSATEPLEWGGNGGCSHARCRGTRRQQQVKGPPRFSERNALKYLVVVASSVMAASTAFWRVLRLSSVSVFFALTAKKASASFNVPLALRRASLVSFREKRSSVTLANDAALTARTFDVAITYAWLTRFSGTLLTEKGPACRCVGTRGRA